MTIWNRDIFVDKAGKHDCVVIMIMQVLLREVTVIVVNGAVVIVVTVAIFTVGDVVEVG